MSNTQLATLTLASLVTLYNDAVDAYGAPNGMGAVTGFKSKSAAIERIEKLCEHGNLAVAFNNDEAVIVDATPSPLDDTGQTLDQREEREANSVGADEGADEGDDDAAGGEGGEGDDDAADDDAVAFGDGKGEIAPSGFKRASDVWLKSNARGTTEREAYRKARRKAARMARKAARAAKEAAKASAE